MCGWLQRKLRRGKPLGVHEKYDSRSDFIQSREKPFVSYLTLTQNQHKNTHLLAFDGAENQEESTPLLQCPFAQLRSNSFTY